VQPLSDDKIRHFLQNELPEGWRILWQTLTQSDDSPHCLLEMARNPYLLTVMIEASRLNADYFWYRGKVSEGTKGPIEYEFTKRRYFRFRGVFLADVIFLLTNIPQSFFNHTGNPISRKSLERMQPIGQ